MALKKCTETPSVRRTFFELRFQVQRPKENKIFVSRLSQPAFSKLATQLSMLREACSRGASEEKNNLAFSFQSTLCMVAARVTGAMTLSEVDVGYRIHKLHQTEDLITFAN